ncbi:MAG: methyltransferase domain-containing protein [Chloroflexota bacterium]
MKKSLLNRLVDPVSKSLLQLKIDDEKEGNVLTGSLVGERGEYPISNGIPRFVLTEDSDQLQTEESFGYKWQQVKTYDAPDVLENARRWLVERYGFANVQEMRRFFANRRTILDAGCGGGFSASLWLHSEWLDSGNAEWVGADISAAIDVAQERLAGIPNTHFIQADVLELPFAGETFDTIFSEGVLHHTPSTERALKSLVPLLTQGGEIMFYVYRKKGAIREFTDDYVRDIVAAQAPEEAWETLRPLTKLGQALAELKVEVDVPEAIPYLGIEAGPIDVQRLFYWHVAKLFWNEAYEFEQNHHINFDWYHPRYAHRQTEEEVRRWCAEAGLSIIHCNVQESGFTVRALKD